MKVQQLFLDSSSPNRPGTKLYGIKAIVFHYTANEAPTANAVNTAKYFNRKWDTGFYFDKSSGKFQRGYVEYGTKTKVDSALYPNLVEPEYISDLFRYGSTQFIADMDGVVECIPGDEVAWAVGDRPLTWDKVFRGQKPLAKKLCSNAQNYYTVSIEMCNNNAVTGDADWEGSVENAKQYMVEFVKSRGLKVDIRQSLHPVSFESLREGEILLLRHYDLTGKVCPKPFVDSLIDWECFVSDFCARLV